MNLLESKRKPITLAELQSCVHGGNASSPIAKLKYRLCAPLRWWLGSRLQIVAMEICSFPLRILASLTIPRLARGIPMSLDLGDYRLENFEEANSYLLSCSEGIQELQKMRRFVSALEVQTYIQAFQRGASWGVHNPYSGKHKGVPSDSSIYKGANNTKSQPLRLAESGGGLGQIGQRSKRITPPPATAR